VELGPAPPPRNVDVNWRGAPAEVEGAAAEEEERALWMK